MSSKTRTRKTTTTTGSAPTLRAVPASDTTATARTDTEDKLWEALHAHPNSTAADLAVTAKIGKSTAGKILAKWQKDGSVTRTPGIAEGGRRAADLWAITETNDVAAEAEAPDVLANDRPADDATEQAPADTTQNQPIIVPTAPDTTVDYTPPAKANSAEPENTEPTVIATEAAQGTTEATTDAQHGTPGPDNESVTKATGSADGATTTDATETATSGKKAARLAPGALRGMVEDYLRDHPTEEFGPTTIAKDLGGKSSGAVSNALDKLVADGTAVKTKDTPRRFALAPAEQAVASASTK